MNMKNLKKAMNHLRHGVKSKNFNMETIATGIIGNTYMLDDINYIPRDIHGELDLYEWAQNFYGISDNTNEWRFLFSPLWGNQGLSRREMKKQAIARIKYIIYNNGKAPNKWSHKSKYKESPIRSIDEVFDLAESGPFVMAYTVVSFLLLFFSVCLIGISFAEAEIELVKALKLMLISLVITLPIIFRV